MRNKPLVIIILLITFCAAFYFSLTKNNIEEIAYDPCAIKVSKLDYSQVISAHEMEGKEKVNQLFIADSEGSIIQPKSGSNYIILANNKPNIVYFNIKFLQISDHKINVIEGFNPEKDKLQLFFPPVFSEYSKIEIIHSECEQSLITFVEIKNEENDLFAAIALLGNINIKPEDIEIFY